MDEYLLITKTLAVILVVGTLLCLPFFQWNVRQFITSQLFIKCVMWIPIYAVFLIVILSQWIVGVGIVSLIMIAALREFSLQTKKKLPISALAYLFIFIAATVTLIAYLLYHPTSFAPLILAVGVCSVMSDVAAFFGGKFFGRHQLPKWINDHKSWEGILGQIIGGVAGAIIVMVTYDPAYGVLFGFIVGLASALGDVINSIAKRSLGIKDWSNAIPGHGGFLDRFSSLMAAYAIIIILTVTGFPIFSV